MKWNLRERFAEFRKEFLTVVCRHPLELLLLLALTVTLIVCLEIDKEPNGPRLLVLGWGALLLLVVNRLAGCSVWRRIYWVAWTPLVPLFLWTGLPEWVESTQAIITFTILTPLALLACRRAVSNERFVADALVYLRSAVLAMLFAYVAYGLFEATLWSAAYIFGFAEARWVVRLSADLFCVMQLFAAPMLFMMMLDRWDGARFGSSRVLEVLLNWVVSPAVIVYAALLYLYLLKILLTWSLPDGGVAYLVFGFTMTALMVKALRLQLEKPAFNWFFDRFSLLSLPIVALFWVGVVRRVGEYGLTEPRIYLLICGGVMTLCVCLFLSRRAGRYLHVVLAAWVVFSAVAYIPALEPERVALRSQARRVERIAARLGCLDAEGRLLHAPVRLADTVHREDYRELYEALEYLERDSAAIARFGMAESNELADLLPAQMRDYVRWGYQSEIDRVQLWIEMPAQVCIDPEGYSRCYVNLSSYDAGGYTFENDTLRIWLGEPHPLLEITGAELLKTQCARSGFDPAQGVEPAPEQALQLLDYRDDRCRILFQQMVIEHRDSVDRLYTEQIHSVWLR